MVVIFNLEDGSGYHLIRSRPRRPWRPTILNCSSHDLMLNHCLPPQPPLVLPHSSFSRSSSSSRFWVFNSTAATCSFSPTIAAYTSFKRVRKGKVSCFRHQESSETDDDPELDHPSLLLPKDSISTFKEAATAIFRIPGKPWTVPWKVETILQVMLLWIASFWFVGSWIIPFLAHVAGFSKESLTYRGQALYSLLTDVAEGLAGIAILHRCLSRFRPLPSDWFRFSLKGNWKFDVGLGCLMFPLVNWLSQVNLNLVPHLPSSPIMVSSVEQSIVARDPVAMALYAIVVAICAPMWEEIVFRGFLLPSLTKYMPVWCSIIVSSVVFALAHFNAQRMLPLIFLGMVMGIVFTRSRNLFASMLLHSFWNGFVFLDLMK